MEELLAKEEELLAKQEFPSIEDIGMKPTICPILSNVASNNNRFCGEQGEGIKWGFHYCCTLPRVMQVYNIAISFCLAVAWLRQKI